MSLHPFQRRIGIFISSPSRRLLIPQRFGDEFLWTRQQDAAAKRQHLGRKWFYKNAERSAYAVNMHLVMVREKARRLRFANRRH